MNNVLTRRVFFNYLTMLCVYNVSVENVYAKYQPKIIPYQRLAVHAKVLKFLGKILSSSDKQVVKDYLTNISLKLPKSLSARDKAAIETIKELLQTYSVIHYPEEVEKKLTSCWNVEKYYNDKLGKKSPSVNVIEEIADCLRTSAELANVQNPQKIPVNDRNVNVNGGNNNNVYYNTVPRVEPNNMPSNTFATQNKGNSSDESQNNLNKKTNNNSSTDQNKDSGEPTKNDAQKNENNSPKNIVHRY